MNILLVHSLLTSMENWQHIEQSICLASKVRVIARTRRQKEVDVGSAEQLEDGNHHNQ